MQTINRFITILSVTLLIIPVALAQQMQPASPELAINHTLGAGSIIQSSFGSPGNFEAVVLEGNTLVHYFKDNSNVKSDWQRGQVITTAATGPGSIIQSSSRAGSRPGNFEVVVLEGHDLVHYFHDNSDVHLPWRRGQIITRSATGPGSIIQSSFGAGNRPGNFEVLALEGSNLVHYFHDNSDVNLPWQRGQVVTTAATGPGSIIQSSFDAGSRPGNFEAVAPEGNNLVHYFHDNSDARLPWQRGQVVTTAATGPGSIIQSSFGADSHPGNFEVVVLEGNDLVHDFHDNSDLRLPWRRAQVITTSATGPGSIIQSNIGSGPHRNFEVLVQEGRQSVVHYLHPNQNIHYPWLRFRFISPEVRPTPMPWTRKIAQLTGEWDREGWNGGGVPRLAHNRTRFHSGLRGTDLGSSFEHKGRTYFLFGDTWRDSTAFTGAFDNDRDPRDGNDDLDAIAYTTDRRAYDGVDLTFNLQAPRVFEGGAQIRQGRFEVPPDGASVNDTMYVYFSTDKYDIDFDGDNKPDAAIMGRTVLARSDDDGHTFQVVYTLSTSKFINVSVQVLRNNRDTRLPIQGDALLIWGSGRYRASDVFLACLPLGGIEYKGGIQYFAGLSAGQPVWSDDESRAAPMFGAGCVGEFSVRWNPYLSRWLMLYNSDNPRGIVLRLAQQPWGEWTEPQIIFDPEAGYGRFMHRPGADHVNDEMFGGSRADEYGGEYGPYQVATYATGVKDRYTKIHFLLSTWNPYQVMQMSAVITADSQGLDPNGYAENASAPNAQKYARISVLQARLARERGMAWDYPGQGNECSADHIEWAQFQTLTGLRTELKSKFQQMMAKLSNPYAKADVYAKVTVDIVKLGANGPYDIPNEEAHRSWALNAVLTGHTDWLISEMNQRIDREGFLKRPFFPFSLNH